MGKCDGRGTWRPPQLVNHCSCTAGSSTGSLEGVIGSRLTQVIGNYYNPLCHGGSLQRMTPRRLSLLASGSLAPPAGQHLPSAPPPANCVQTYP